MPWETNSDGYQEYRPDEEEKDPNWCFLHNAMWPACEDGEADK